MASGPYQSNLLRFFAGQYWQGLARHRQAVWKTRSTIAWSSEIGFAVVRFPVMAAAQASQKTFQKLRQSSAGLRLSLGRARTATKLLDLSGFYRLSAVSTRLNFQRLQPLLKKLVDEGRLLKASTTTAISDASAVAPSVFEAVEAEAAMALTLLSVGDSLLPQQINVLAGLSDRGLASLLISVGQRWRSVSRIFLAPFGRQSARPEEVTETLANRFSEVSKGADVGQITGVASDLKTRSLVLVISHSCIWNGLTRSQQIDLQQSISDFIQIGLVQAEETSDSRSISSCPSEVSAAIHPASVLSAANQVIAALGQKENFTAELARPLISFWVAVLQILDGLRPPKRLPALPLAIFELPSKCGEGVLVPCEKGSLIVQPFYFLMGVIFGAEVLTDTPMGIRLKADDSFSNTAKTPRLMSDGMTSSRQSICIETDVIAVDYIQHPLEKLLKWVDRVLLWVESRWAALNAWCMQLLF